jgi:tetratricopeptide (TPR) repeat protein
MCDDLEKNFVLTLPTITFKDRMTLDLGDLTLKLIYFGEGRHTGDDIIIHCPEEKLLFTGDLFFKGTMLISFRPQFDAQRWIEVLDEVLKDMSKVKLVFDTHNGRMTGKFLALWHKYLVDVWEDLTAAKKEGLNYDAVQERFSYDKKFTYIEKSGVDPSRLRRDHQTGLRMVWNKVLGLQSAATLLRQTISESGIKTAIETYRKMRSGSEEKYYFDEREFNTLGYQLMGSNQIKEAIEIFKLNVEAYPKSWNVYDSLGEAYMNDGQTKLAIQHYKKSLELNPQNTNAEAMLKRFENPAAQGTDN